MKILAPLDFIFFLTSRLIIGTINCYCANCVQSQYVHLKHFYYDNQW